jgi:hypothetical protein
MTGHLPTAIREAVSRWDQDRQDDWNERAAMIEYGDHVSRDQAEQRAYFQLRQPIKDKAKRAA